MRMGGPLMVVLVVVALALLVYLSGRTGNLLRVDVADGALAVRPRGLNRLWAMKGEVRVPLAHVSQVRTNVDRRTVPSGWRLPGTYVPGLLQAGTYRTKGERSFWLVGRARNVTVIDCAGGRFARIVLQLSQDTADELRRAVSNTPSS